MLTVTGQNLSFLLKTYKKLSLDELVSDKKETKKSEIFPFPVEEVWQVNMMEEISLLKKEHLNMELDPDDLEDILNFICLV